MNGVYTVDRCCYTLKRSYYIVNSYGVERGVAVVKAVGYYRVSTAEQGRSGLGLDAQREAVRQWCETAGAELIADYSEVSSGKGADALDRRPQLAAAMREAERKGAIVVVAKLDRLSRSVAFVSALMAHRARFVVAELPQADSFQLHIYAALAEQERQMISDRTRAALQRAKAAGKVLGNPRLDDAREAARAGAKAAADADAQRLAPIVTPMVDAGLSLREIARRLTATGTPTPRGRTEWQAAQVGRLVRRLGLSTA